MPAYFSSFYSLALWGAIFFGIVFYGLILLILLPQYAHRLNRRHQNGRARRLLEWLLRCPAPGGSGAKTLVRYYLADLEFQEQRYPEAERQYRLLLACTLPAGLKSEVHRRLADTLEAQGQTLEAQQEMDRAGSAAAGGSDMASLAARGDVLKRQHRYREAMTVYEQALQTPQAAAPALRAQLMVKIGLAAFDGGQPDLTREWMERAIAVPARDEMLRIAHNMAGIAIGNLGQHEEAIAHQRQAAEIAGRLGKSEEVGRALAMVASLQMRQGDLAQALQTGAEIERQGLTTRTWLVTKAECLQALGQFEDARTALYTARELQEPNKSTIPHYEKRQQALVCLGLARVLAQEGQGETAWNQLQEAVHGFAGDGKLSLWCDGTAAWVLALLNHPEQARAKMRSVEERMGQFESDRSGRLGCLQSLARAAFVLGDLADAEQRWAAYLAAAPDPVWLPKGYFSLGECRRGQGNREGARQAYRQATQIPISGPKGGGEAWPPPPTLAAGITRGSCVDTLEARLARARLEQEFEGDGPAQVQ